MQRAKSITTSIISGALIIGFGMISNACTGQSPLGISLEDEEHNFAQEQPVIPGDPSTNPPPPPENGDE